MAPPPKYIILRKLVGRYFDKFLPKEPIYLNDEQNKLFECWQTFGIDNVKCKEHEEKFDKLYTQSANFQTKMQGLRLKQYVMSNLPTPVYKSRKKGTRKEDRLAKKRDIFDGLI